MEQVVKRAPGEHWSQEELDFALNTVLEADSTQRYLGLCVVVGQRILRDPRAVHRIIWGLATRITNTQYEPGPTKVARTDKPTFADIQMVKWATETHTHDRRRKDGPCTPEHLAKILGHPLEMVKELWHIHGPAKGRKGFFDA